MKTTRHLGVWMDHSTAHLMDVSGETITSTRIESEFTHREKTRTLEKGEYMMHNDEQQKQHAYYKKIGDAIRNYDQVIVFGPTSAKNEFHNMLKGDRHFENVRIEVKSADKMTENQQKAFVKDYFKNSVYTRKAV